MIEKNLKDKTISGMLWNAFQRFGTMILSFVSNIVLAWLLLPEDFGSIGMLSIFIALSEVFIDGGFGSALIQKKNASQEDFSTIFYWNLMVSFLLFVALQFFSPMVAEFYHMPVLSNILRVTSTVLLINGFSVIQTTILTKELSFRLLAKIHVFSTLIGVLVSIGAAYVGLGVWSLVIKSILSALITAILLWTLNKWRPSFVFSWQSFKSLFSFGGLMLLSNLVNSLFENIQSLVIGRFYSAKDLGFYTQAKRLDEVPSSSISKVVTQVSFPVFSKIADNINLLRNSVRKNIMCTTYLIFPLQFLLIVIAEPLIIFLFSERWADSIILFQILCVYSMFISLNAINTNIYKAMGKSNIYFRVQLAKRIIGIALLLFGVRFGVVGITVSLAISGLLWWIISATVNARLLNYGFINQFGDVLITLLLSLMTGVCVYFTIKSLSILPIARVVIGITCYFILYITLSGLFKLEPMRIYLSIIKKMLKKEKL